MDRLSLEERIRVAVLPLATTGTGPEEAYLADGVTEEVTDRLAQVKRLRLVGRGSVLSYKKNEKRTDIARELLVESVVEGSIRKEGSRLCVAAQLVSCAKGEQLWAADYDGTFDDVFAFLSQIANGVVGALRIELSQPEKQALGKKPTGSMEAYEDFLRGRELYRKGSEQSLKKALELFLKSVELDPSFARAHVAVAECHQRLASGGDEPRDVMLPAVKSSLVHALKLDPDIPEAHVALALLHLNDDNAPGVEAEAKRALELDPSLPEAHNLLFDVAAIEGEPEEMVRSIEAAYGLDPIEPLYIEEVGQAYFHTGREKDALEHWRKTERLDPAGTYRNLTCYYLSKKDIGKAKKFHRKVEKLTPDSPWVAYMRGFICAVAGDRKKALLAVGELEENAPAPLAYNFEAYVYHALGDLDRYFEHLNRALEEHSMIATFVMYSPLLAKAREDPRYKELVQRLRRLNGLAPGSSSAK